MCTRVILNPVAGGGSLVVALRRAVAALPGGAEIRLTGGPGDGRRLAREACREGVGRIVVAGGDGTVSDVASGLLEAGHAGEVGILPIGTGNDLARSLGIPPGLRASLELLRHGRAAPVDAIGLDPTSGPPAPAFAWNAAVGGFCGRISDRMPVGLKRRWKSLSYLRAAATELRCLRPHAVTLDVDGERLRLDILMLVVANGRFAGGRIPLAPGAVPDDGRIDVVAIRAIPMARLAALAPAVLAGRHLASRHVVQRKARRVGVEAGPGFWINVDGETWREGSAGFEVRPAALRFVRPVPR
ncbi:MAG: diacylglycerol kinase family lipid kinase [Gemmatimonadota bacterium]